MGTVGPTITRLTNTIPDYGLPDLTLPLGESFTVTAQFTNGMTSTSFDVWPVFDQPFTTTQLVRGDNGQFNLVLESVATNITAIRVYGKVRDPNNPNQRVFTNFDVSISSFSNGVAALPQIQTEQHLADYWCYTRAITGDGVTGSYGNAIGNSSVVIPAHHEFVDLSLELKQNLQFLLRSATVTQPFSCYAGDTSSHPLFHAASSTDYEFAGYGFGDDAMWPRPQNFVYRNFVFDAGDGLSAWSYYDTGGYYLVYGWLGTGAAYLPVEQARVVVNAKYQYPGYTNNPTPPFVLGTGSLIYHRNLFVPNTTNAFSELGLVPYSNGQLGMSSGTRNVYGLPLTGLQIVNSNLVWTIAPGGVTGQLNTNETTVSFFSTATPNLQTVGYHFTKWDSALQPGNSSFSNTVASPFLVMSWGQLERFVGWTRQAITNGYANKFAYLQQYFDKACKVGSNGVATTQQTGILSPYGEFFPTETGPVALLTKPDIDPPYARGTCVVQVVKIQLDVNHDGIMDLSLTGPDNISQLKPFEFWANNDYDRGHVVDGNDFEEDDLGEKEIRKLPVEQRVPDAQYTTNGLPAIPCKRDLEDYARIWIPGLAALMNSLPTNYTVYLQSDYPFRFFRAGEPTGGTNYLFDETTAQSQVSNSASLYLGETAYESPLLLNGMTNLGEHFIFCAAQPGNDVLSLEVYDANQNYVGGTRADITIKDSKDMFERWTVGERPGYAPTNTAQLVVENLPDSITWWLPATPFQYESNTDTNTPYILFVHGWNMETWEKDRYAETAFKRLYWQRYQGRFGSFRWPTGNNFSGDFIDLVLDSNNYDTSEFNAWKSGTGLRNLLVQLNSQYPSQVRLMAHSMGNVVAGEALRTNTALVHTCVAMQGAVPAHTYDTNATTRTICGVIFSLPIVAVCYLIRHSDPSALKEHGGQLLFAALATVAISIIAMAGLGGMGKTSPRTEEQNQSHANRQP